MLHKPKPIELPHIIRHLTRLQRDSHGRTSDERWFPPGLPVFEYDLVMWPSYVKFSTEYVRARDIGQARERIKQQHPTAKRYDW